MPLAFIDELARPTASHYKNLLQQLSTFGGIITVLVGIITLFVAILKFRSESKLTREQRARDLRWKQCLTFTTAIDIQIRKS
jgi:hypothetical protein